MALGCLALSQLMLALAGLDADVQREIGSAVMVANFAVFFIIGLVVRRRSGSVEAGMRAGLVSGVYAGAMAALGAAALAALAPNVDIAAAEQITPAAIGVGATLFAGLLNLVVLATIGAGLASVGALAGRPKTGGVATVRIRGHLGR